MWEFQLYLFVFGLLATRGGELFQNLKKKKSHSVFFVILYFILFKMFCTLKNIILICRNLEKKILKSNETRSVDLF